MRHIFIRHGEAIHNVDSSIYEANRDELLVLTARGEDQARRCGTKFLPALRLPRDVRSYSSDQVRAGQTAELVLEAMGAPIQNIKTSALREFYMARDGKPFVDFEFEEYVRNPLLSWKTECGMYRTLTAKELLENVEGHLRRVEHSASCSIHFSHHFPIGCALIRSALLITWANPHVVERKSREIAKIVPYVNVDHCKPYDTQDEEQILSVRVGIPGSRNEGTRSLHEVLKEILND